MKEEIKNRFENDIIPKPSIIYRYVYLTTYFFGWRGVRGTKSGEHEKGNSFCWCQSKDTSQSAVGKWCRWKWNSYIESQEKHFQDLRHSSKVYSSQHKRLPQEPSVSSMTWWLSSIPLWNKSSLWGPKATPTPIRPRKAKTQRCRSSRWLTSPSTLSAANPALGPALGPAHLLIERVCKPSRR